MDAEAKIVEEAEYDGRAPAALSRSQDEESSRADARERRDIVSGEVMPENRIIRFAFAPDGSVVPDVAAKLPGRGAWVAATRAAVNTAVEKKLFGRAAKANVTADSDLALLEVDLAVGAANDRVALLPLHGGEGVDPLPGEEPLERQAGALVLDDAAGLMISLVPRHLSGSIPGSGGMGNGRALDVHGAVSWGGGRSGGSDWACDYRLDPGVGAG